MDSIFNNQDLIQKIMVVCGKTIGTFSQAEFKSYLLSKEFIEKFMQYTLKKGDIITRSPVILWEPIMAEQIGRAIYLETLEEFFSPYFMD